MGLGRGRSRTDSAEGDGEDESGLDSLLREVARLPDAGAPDRDRSGQRLAEIVGERLAGRFVVGRRLGQGGMGVVFEAFDEQRGEVVALKTLERLDGDAIYRMKKEFRALAEVVHPNLVRLHELFSDGERWFFTMARVEGVPFLAHVRPHGADGVDAFCETERDVHADGAEPDPGAAAVAAGPLRERALRDALAGLAAGVRALHGAGKLHRDLKPSNVLVHPSGRVTILDFGLASPVKEDDRSRDLAIAGTPAYMAPEQLAGRTSPASDWYAFGVMLYEALSGRRPFEGSTPEIIAEKTLGRAPAPLREIAKAAPSDLTDLATALLRASPEDRPGEHEILACVGAAPAAAEPLAVAAGLFVGRDAELCKLRSAFAAVRGGTPATLYVAGVSGLGKTALIERFLGEVRGRAEVLTGRCYEREAVPFKALDAIVDALSRLLRDLDPIAAARLTPRSATDLCRLFPVLERVPAFADTVGASAAGDPQEARRRAFLALKETFARLGDQRPVLLFIDDLQWGDVDSAAFLTELTAPPSPPRVLLVGAYRSDEVERSPLLRILRDHAGRGEGQNVETLLLEPLDDAAATALAAAVLGPGADEERARAVAAEARGNPFFLTQLARASTGAIAAGTTLAEVVGAEVRALPFDAQALLEVIAVGAGPVRRDVALAAAGLSPTNDEAVPRLVGAALLRSSGSRSSDALETYHDRIRETVAAALPAERARRHHRALAEALGALPEPPAAQLAFHFREAGERASAGTWALRAADVAAEALAFDRAAELYGAVLALGAEGPEERARVERARADALVRAGRGADAASIYIALAARAPSDEARSDLEQLAGEQLVAHGEVARAKAVLAPVFARLGVRWPHPWLAALGALVIRAWLELRGWSVAAPGRGEERDDRRARVLVRIGRILFSSDPPTGLFFIARAALDGRRVGSARLVGMARAVMASFLVIQSSKRLASGLAELERSAAMIASEGEPTPEERGWLFMIRALMFAYAGRWSEVVRVLDAFLGAFEAREPPSPAVRNLVFAWGIIAELRRGRFRRAAQLAAELGRLSTEYGFLGARMARLVGNQVLVELAAGRASAAREQVRAARVDWVRAIGHEDVQAHNLDLAMLHVDMYDGDVAGAERLALVLVRRSRTLMIRFLRSFQLMTYVFSTRALLQAWLLHPGDAARGRLARRFAAGARRSAAPFDLPWCDLLDAGIACASGDRARGLVLLRDAIRTCEAAEYLGYAACARFRLGVGVGGDEGQRLCDEAAEWLGREGIVDPPRFADLLVPGIRGA